VLQHSTHNPKVEGSNPAIAGKKKEIMAMLKILGLTQISLDLKKKLFDLKYLTLNRVDW
jgi:hypothetical protein